MDNQGKPLLKSQALAAKGIYATMTALKNSGGQMSFREVIQEVEKEVDFTDWEKERLEKSGNIRWQAILHFFSIDCVKAGFLVKKRGTWTLTPEGETALALEQRGLLEAAMTGYRQWKAQRVVDPKPPINTTGDDVQITTLDEIEQKAIDGLQEYISKKNPYEFQDLIAALLKGMGYYIRFVAPRRKDGGIDIIAYRDPLGTMTPRIKAQIKHRSSPANVQEIRQLTGLLQKEGDIGMFVSSGGFTPDAKSAASHSHVHIELIDFERFISLWQDFYSKLSDEDKNMLPLRPIYFLGVESSHV